MAPPLITDDQPLTVFSDRFGRVVKSGTVLSVDKDLLRVIVTRLELGHELHAVNEMSWSFRDAADPCSIHCLGLALLDE